MIFLNNFFQKQLKYVSFYIKLLKNYNVKILGGL